MSSIAVIVPVLGRPKRAAPLVQSVAAAATVPTRVVFVCTPGDTAEITACEATGATVIVLDVRRGRGDYARKVNAGYRATDEPWLFQAADDLVFRHGWDAVALAAAAESKAGVIGTRDLGNDRTKRGTHSTHSLIARWYVDRHGTIDNQRAVLHEGYHHNFCDDELVETAKARGLWCMSNAVVEHMHPHWRKGDMDTTYRIGLARFGEDRRLFQSRGRLWRRRR